ncbi:carbamoyl phosphate synthase small subunit [Candidatus Kaiserbacteria bacterium RIFCSPHIGHO2_02_FULL_49_16]|uniref:Carbamoyl phosphate synthase small chain n=1 Tax=Candidatus Kaiserbacteria bacterium RIFCSPHIGHO2_02_FULL_49_16 TaxID=1798490 RepID=A0A1F6D9H7_9BACT|nr:MAG: carbamoyl phosphate synthase small subunit [Candidatus Kaiserbacteria bacterium RIFCSPHIGHO2_02_FULL_49_16]
MKLILKDGTVFEGKSFGAPVGADGEVVFNTGMVGYVETLSDPSYAGQIIVLTYPLVGNYGVPDRKFFESAKIQAAGLVVAEYSENYSHSKALESLSDWLKSSGVPAITGADTRALTKKLREHGVMLGVLSESITKKTKFVDPNQENLVAKVSIKKPQTYGSGPTTIILVDCGAKENILRSLMRPGIKVVRVPWNYDFSNDKFDGVVISNGPGDPNMCVESISNIKRAMILNKPILGICLGTQLMALAGGGSTYKLKYGHRSQNQPCINSETKRCYITSQNHGYAVDAKSLPHDWDVWFTNANDGSVEGIKHKTKPWRAVQFHPEASPGPTDTAWIFERFIQDLIAKKI